MGLYYYQYQWSWVDGNAMEYSYWYKKEPDQMGCGLIHPSGRWKDHYCNNHYRYICEIGK